MADLAVVCCVEAGYLEAMTVRMAASLRRFGGALAGVDILGVTPRRGLALSDRTQRAFEKLDVRHIAQSGDEPYAWNDFMNKPHALLAAERETGADILCWLDSDVLVVGEPVLLALGEGVDLVACPSDKNVGTCGPDDPNEPYWRAVCDVLAIEMESLPFVTTYEERARIRLYFNSGVFSYRRGKGFAEAFLSDCCSLLDARVASGSAGIFFTDQVALGLTAHRLGFSIKELPSAYNLPIGSKSLAPGDDQVRKAMVLHHHDAMWPPHWPGLLETLGRCRPDVSDFLEPYGPLSIERSFFERAALKLLRIWRNLRRGRHLAQCRQL